MLNYLWGIMIIAGVLWGAVTGNINAVTDGILESAKDAVALCITMLGIMSFWSGIMKVGERAGFINRLSVMISPIIRFLFPKLPRNHAAGKYITTNIIANVLGLGWAATPAGLKAMEELSKLEAERGNNEYIEEKTAHPHPTSRKSGGRAASNEMCTLLVLNISSLQLIPVNMIAYRSQYGSTEPAAIIAPAIVATVVSTLVAIGFCKIMSRKA